MGISRIVSSARRREESMTQREMERYESVLFLGVVLFSIFFFRFLALAMGISRSVLPSARIIKGETSQNRKKKERYDSELFFWLLVL